MRRGRNATRDAVLIEIRGDHEAAEETLLDEMMSGSIPVTAVLAGLLSVVSTLAKIIEEADVPGLDVSEEINRVLR